MPNKNHILKAFRCFNIFICSVFMSLLLALPLYIPIFVDIRKNLNDFLVLLLIIFATSIISLAFSGKIRNIWKITMTTCAISSFATPISIFLSTALIAYILNTGLIKLSLMATAGILGAKTLSSSFIALGMIFLSIRTAIK